jgi:histidinol-phosphate phosphatase family protein
VLRIILSSEEGHVKGPAIFLDRDGIINCRRPNNYVLNWGQFVFVPGIREALKRLADLRLPMIVISNQAAIGKGLLDPSGLEEITAKMQQALLEDGTVLAAAYYCPHRADENCMCRKPKPELLLSAARDLSVDLNHSVFIGDSESDVQAARAAGCQAILFGAGVERFADPSLRLEALAVVQRPEDLFDAVVKRLRDAETLGLGSSSAPATR